MLFFVQFWDIQKSIIRWDFGDELIKGLLALWLFLKNLVEYHIACVLILIFFELFLLTGPFKWHQLNVCGV